MSLLLNPPLVRIPESMAQDPEVAAYLRGINTQFEQLYRYLQQGATPIDFSSSPASNAFASSVISGQANINEDFDGQIKSAFQGTAMLRASLNEVDQNQQIALDNIDQIKAQIDQLESIINGINSSFNTAILRLSSSQGSMDDLITINKDSIVSAINELTERLNSAGN